MNRGTRILGIVSALWLLALCLPQDTPAGICADGFSCCYSWEDCWYQAYETCLPFSGLCSDSYTYCNTDEDCSTGELCMIRGHCEASGDSCFEESLGYCVYSGYRCRSDSDCGPGEPCGFYGVCSNDPEDYCSTGFMDKACTDFSRFCSSNEDCTSPATCEPLRTCVQGPDTCVGYCFTSFDCLINYGGGACTGDPYCCEGTCEIVNPLGCPPGDACNTEMCLAPPVNPCGVCLNSWAGCNNDGECDPGDICIRIGYCEGVFYPCTDEMFGYCSSTGNYCRTDSDCQAGEACLLEGQCTNNGASCVQEVKYCTDMGGFCTTDSDCTAPATCGVLRSCAQEPGQCTGQCFTDDDCLANYGGGTCTGDLYCCEGTCGPYDYCDGGVCEIFCPEVPCEPGDDCSDYNPCTDDDCVDGFCRHTNNTDPCNDWNVCTTGDTCEDGACVGGPPVVCDDGNPCTENLCDPAQGCLYACSATNPRDPCCRNPACSGAPACRGPRAMPWLTILLDE